MADFRKLALDLIAADGKIDESEIKILKKSLYADGKIQDDEIAFLIDVKTAVLRKTKDSPTVEFDKFFLKALTDNILTDKVISAQEAGTIKKHVVGDKKLDVQEIKKFLMKLKKDATTTDPEFDKVYDAFMKKIATPAS